MTASEQARADALADAETLQEYLRRLPLGSLLRPGMSGLGLCGSSHGVRKAIARGHLNVAARRASAAAHAAFRAVPGLRGER